MGLSGGRQNSWLAIFPHKAFDLAKINELHPIQRIPNRMLWILLIRPQVMDFLPIWPKYFDKLMIRWIASTHTQWTVHTRTRNAYVNQESIGPNVIINRHKYMQSTDSTLFQFIWLHTVGPWQIPRIATYPPAFILHDAWMLFQLTYVRAWFVHRMLTLLTFAREWIDHVAKNRIVYSRWQWDRWGYRWLLWHF